MGEIGRGQEVDPFNFGPIGQRVQGHVPGRRPRKLGMDVEVGDVLHLSSPKCIQMNLTIQGKAKKKEKNVPVPFLDLAIEEVGAKIRMMCSCFGDEDE